MLTKKQMEEIAADLRNKLKRQFRFPDDYDEIMIDVAIDAALLAIAEYDKINHEQ